MKNNLTNSLAKYVNLQVGDNDLIGNKFNGHDLHINLRKMGIESSHLVWNKESDDKNTYVIAGEKRDRTAIRSYNEYIQRLYDLDNVHNPLIYDIIYNKLFLDADVVHLHLLHNGLWDLNLLPLMSKLKPIVWTVHDMWIATGDPHAPERPDYFFPLLGDAKNLDFNWELKKEAIKNSNVTFVVASKYMEKAMNEYPLFKEKGVVYIPFGLNFDIFYPRDISKTRKVLGLGLSEKVILVRGDVRAKKGLDYIEYVMDKLGSKYKLHFLIVGPSELVVPNNVKTTYYGWVKEDELMAKLYSAADLFLMPSTREYFGMMAIESMACGTLPLVLDGTSLPDTVNAPSCGVSTPQDMKEYSDVVDYYLNNNAARTKKERKCVDYVRDKHDMSKYLRSLDGLYNSVINNHVREDSDNQILEKLKVINEIQPCLKPVNTNVSSGDLSKYQEKNLFFEATVEPLRAEIARLNTDNDIIRAEITTLNTDNIKLEDNISAIYNSKRWKLASNLAKLRLRNRKDNSGSRTNGGDDGKQ
jgi:glycosyltransferase involved in cell wall biosynthesis